jgi:hypothetical protein
VADSGEKYCIRFFGKVIWKNAPPWCIVVRRQRQLVEIVGRLKRKEYRGTGREHVMNQQAVRGRTCETCSFPLDDCRCFTVGDQVRFREILDPGDECCLFDVIEDNGDRLMIRLVCDLPIRPVKVVRRADIRKT